MDEVFGEENFVSQITTVKSAGSSSIYLPNTTDFILWYAQNRPTLKYRELWREKIAGEEGGTKYTEVSQIGQLQDEMFAKNRFARLADLTSPKRFFHRFPSRVSWKNLSNIQWIVEDSL